MVNAKWCLVLCLIVGATGCASASGALGPDGYEQKLTKYRLNYTDASNKKFLSDDWVLDNYAYDSTKKEWSEKKGEQYRAKRYLDEDGDGTITRREQNDENVFDLRFVNSHDNAVIWFKVHPMGPSDSKRDLDVILENYADGLEGTGLFEQSSLFGLAHDKARHFTTFIVKKEPAALGALPAIRGVIEIADVDKLRLEPTHRDSKAELVFAKVVYLQKLSGKPNNPLWPVVVDSKSQLTSLYYAQRTGLLVVGYYDDAARFDSHVADLHALLAQIVIPSDAVPPTTAKPPTAVAAAPAPATAETPAPAAAETPAPAGTTSAPAVTTPAVAPAPVTGPVPVTPSTPLAASAPAAPQPKPKAAAPTVAPTK